MNTESPATKMTGYFPAFKPAYEHGDALHPDTWKNGNGRFVADVNISQYDRRKEAVLTPILIEAAEIANRLRDFKQRAFQAIFDFDLESAEDYGVEILTAKRNGTTFSFDQQWKIQINSSPTLAFDGRIKAAIELIEEILNDWEQKSDPAAIGALRALLEKDAAGNLNPRRLLALRRHRVDDERWAVAMQAIADAVIESDRTAYLNVYMRQENGNGRFEWELVPLSLAKA